MSKAIPDSVLELFTEMQELEATVNLIKSNLKLDSNFSGKKEELIAAMVEFDKIEKQDKTQESVASFLTRVTPVMPDRGWFAMPWRVLSRMTSGKTRSVITVEKMPNEMCTKISGFVLGVRLYNGCATNGTKTAVVEKMMPVLFAFNTKLSDEIVANSLSKKFPNRSDIIEGIITAMTNQVCNNLVSVGMRGMSTHPQSASPGIIKELSNISQSLKVNASYGRNDDRTFTVPMFMVREDNIRLEYNTRDETLSFTHEDVVSMLQSSGEGNSRYKLNLETI